MKTRLSLSWNLILGLFVWIQYAEAARATTLILGKTKPEPKIDTIPMDDENATTAVLTSSNETSGMNSQGNVTHKLTGVPQIDYVYDPNLPRELNGFNLTDYPFYNSVPEDIDFKCDGLHDGFYASVPHKCQVYHHCLFGTRYDFLCANYTAFDQKTFICHFASEIDCKNSPKHYNRNEALYKAATTTTAAAPIDYSKYRRPHPDESRRRRPYRKRKPTYEYYDDYEDSQDYYEDEDPPPPPVSKRKKRPRPNNRDSYKEREHGEDIEDYEEKDALPPSAPNKSLYDRPRLAPKIRRPVPNNERDKYDYGNDPRVIKQPSEERSHPEDYEADEKRKDHSHRKSEKPDFKNSGEDSSESDNYRRGNHREKTREEEKRPSKKRRPSSSESYEDELERPSRHRTKSEGFNKRRESEEDLKEEKKGKQETVKLDEEDEEDDERYIYRKKDVREKEWNRSPHSTHRFKDYEDYPDDRPTTKSRGESQKNRQEQSAKYSKPNEQSRDEVSEDSSEKKMRRKPAEAQSEDSKGIRIRNKEIREKNIKNQESSVPNHSRESLKNKQRNGWEVETPVLKPSDKDYDDEDREVEERERDEAVPRRNVKNSGSSSERSGESFKNNKAFIQRIKISKETNDDSEEGFAPVPAPRPAYITDIGESEKIPVRSQNRKVPNAKLSSKESVEEEDFSEEKTPRGKIGSKKSKESGEIREEEVKDEDINLKVPYETVNEELAPRAPQFPQVSLRRRPFLPSRGGFLPRGLVPVGEKSSIGPTINHKHGQQEHVKSRDQGVIEFRTKVSASIGVEQPQLTSHFVRPAEPVRNREHAREPPVENADRPETLQAPEDEDGNGGIDEESASDDSSLPFKPYSIPARYNPPTEKIHFRPQSTENSNIFLPGRYQPTAKEAETPAKTEEKRKDSSLHSSSPSYTFSNPQERLGPQTFYSENPKFKTTLVVPDHLVPKSAQTPNIKYNTYRPPTVRHDQKSDSSHLYGETNFRKPNAPSYDYTIANAGNSKFPTKTTDDNLSSDYDDSLNDALQQYSTLHPRNVPSGLINQNVLHLQLQQQQQQQLQQQQQRQQQPQGFKRRHHEQESVSTFYPSNEKQPLNLPVSRVRNVSPPGRQHPVQKLAASPSTLHQSYVINPYVGVLRKHPTDIFTRVQ